MTSIRINFSGVPSRRSLQVRSSDRSRSRAKSRAKSAYNTSKDETPGSGALISIASERRHPAGSSKQLALQQDPADARDVAQIEKTTDSAVVLNTRDPTACARELLRLRFAERPLLYYRGEFLRYGEGSYRPVEDRAIRSEINDFIDSAVSSTGARCIPSRHIVSEIGDALASITFLTGETDLPLWFHPHSAPFNANEVIAFRNGLLHWPSKTFIAPDPNFVTRNAVAFDYDVDAPTPRRWKQFLTEIWPDDVEARQVLAELIGYILSGDTTQQKMFLWVSPSRGGKGTAAHIIGKLIGELNVCAPTLTNLSNEFGLQQLIGRQLAIISDMRDVRAVDRTVVAENLLRITGEDAIAVNRKNRDHLTVRLPTRLLLLSNEAPDLRDASGALANRLIILMSAQSFVGREDPRLKGALERELSGILNWALRGLDRLHKRGFFCEPQSSRLMRGQVNATASPVRTFVNERCKLARHASVEKQRLFLAWRVWCERRNHKDVGDDVQFAKKLYALNLGLGSSRPRAGKSRQQHFSGICLAD